MGTLPGLAPHDSSSSSNFIPVSNSPISKPQTQTQTPQGAGLYSEGLDDDLNKVVWSAIAEDPRLTAENVTRQYARYHWGAALQDVWTEARPLAFGHHIATRITGPHACLEGSPTCVCFKSRV
jgi:hypothetical protein